MSETMYRCPCGSLFASATGCALHQLSSCERQGWEPVSFSAQCPHAWPGPATCPQCAAVVVAAARGQVERVA